MSGCEGLGGKLHFQSKKPNSQKWLLVELGPSQIRVLWGWYFKYVHMHVNESLRDNLIMQ